MHVHIASQVWNEGRRLELCRACARGPEYKSIVEADFQEYFSVVFLDFVSQTLVVELVVLCQTHTVNINSFLDFVFAIFSLYGHSQAHICQTHVLKTRFSNSVSVSVLSVPVPAWMVYVALSYFRGSGRKIRYMRYTGM